MTKKNRKPMYFKVMMKRTIIATQGMDIPAQEIYVSMPRGKYKNLQNNMGDKFVEDFYVPISEAEYRMSLMNK